MIGTVPLSALRRAATGSVACDRVYGTAGSVVCLKTNRGLVTSFEAVAAEQGMAADRTWALPGIPSRTG